ncbi:MAG: phosphatidylglycerol lysyltransferase domain-containing protein [Sarcina sp.]
MLSIIFCSNAIISSLIYIITLNILGLHTPIILSFIFYILAMLIGLVSFLPLGIFAFDISLVLLFYSFTINKSLLIFSIVLFRLTYYIVPLIVSGLILLLINWKKINISYNKVPDILLSKASFFILRFFIFVSGLSLLISTAFPWILTKIPELYFLSSATILHFSTTLVVVVGFLLIVMSKFLKYKTKSVYILTIVFLVIGSVLTFDKTINYIATGYLLLCALIILLSKNEFSKKSFIVSVEDIISTVFVLLVFWITYFIIGYVSITKKFPKHYRLSHVIHDYKSLIGIGTLGFVLALLFLYFIYLLGKHLNKIPAMTLDECEEDVSEFLKTHTGTSLTHLIYLRDKYVFFSSDKKGMIQYSIISNKLIVLGNPLGHREDLNKLISEFYDFANLYGYIPIFFEVSGSMMDILHDYGYEFMKLGEAAIVNLPDFTISGQKMQKVRTCVNKITKANYTFDVAPPQDITDDLITELKKVSDLWLNNRKEMGFSMGFFNAEYIKRSAIGIVRDETQTIKGFVTIMPTYGENSMFCSDLMRYSKDVPRGLMDYMFSKLLLWGQENGYKEFNFGVSPLANVGFSKYSFLSERVASQIYYHGNIFYSFSGLKNFKAKYAHTWEPKFLAYKNKFALPITSLQSNLLVSNPQQKYSKKA